MAWNFRKRIKIAPGIVFNISKSGVSTTIGTRGASVNVGKRGSYLNTGIPGTGLYSRQKLSTTKSGVNKSLSSNTFFKKERTNTSNAGCIGFILYFICLFIILMIVNWTILLISGEKKWSNQFLFAYIIAFTILIITIKSFNKIRNYLSKKSDNKTLDDSLDEDESTTIDNSESDKANGVASDGILKENPFNGISREQQEAFKTFELASIKLNNCEQIWFNNKKISLLSDSFDKLDKVRNILVPTLKGVDYDYYIYPTFVLKVDNNKDYSIVKIENIEIFYDTERVMEMNPLYCPKDARVVSSSYLWVNKDGSPDRRHKYNEAMPVYQFGVIDIPIFNISYKVSNADAAEAYVNALKQLVALAK